MEIEAKWQEHWMKNKSFLAHPSVGKEKFYVLSEFPYVSGEGLHVGHCRSYTAMDVIARYRRIKGYNVLFPFGWDAFGLPTENYAIANKIHPEIVTKRNIEHFRKQCQKLGFSFDWEKEINTSDPNYYKWTQWIFIQFFNKGLAYKAKKKINWCPNCKTGLANEEVIGGACERCSQQVEQREREQWMLKITKYADRLIEGLNEIDFPISVIKQQKNWIGKKEGLIVFFDVFDKDLTIEGFTDKPELLESEVKLIISPEHPIINKVYDHLKNQSEVKNYIKHWSKKSDFERIRSSKNTLGLKLDGIKVRHPLSDRNLSVYICEQILSDDFPSALIVSENEKADVDIKLREAITNQLLSLKKAQKRICYKLKDWVFSRQRYWGEPIPMVFCEQCGWIPVKIEDLPVELPKLSQFNFDATEDSPLSAIESWINTICPNCHKKAKRETDTMPQWAGSSWYYLRYLDFDNQREFLNPKLDKHWMPVDWYNGGAEHNTLHLLYSRFFHQALYDLKLVSTPEPYRKRTCHGMVLGENNEKMSKSRGNVVNPDELVKEFGADTLRIYEMFMGPFDQSLPWSLKQISGVHRFTKKVWQLQFKVDKKKNFEDHPCVHESTQKIETYINNTKFNNAIAQLMTLYNEISTWTTISKKSFETFLLLLSPFAPHITEELWSRLGNQNSIQKSAFPSFDNKKIAKSFYHLPIMINGKRRDEIKVDINFSETKVKKIVYSQEKINKYLKEKKIIREVYIHGKIMNIVVE